MAEGPTDDALDIDALEALLAKATPIDGYAANAEHATARFDLDRTLRNAAPKLIDIARAVKAWGEARRAGRVTQHAVEQAGLAHRAERLNVVLREAWEQAGNANLRAHDLTSRRFSDLCRLADSLTTEPAR